MNDRGDASADSLFAGKIEASLNLCRPLPHAQQPEVAAVGRAVRRHIESQAVVLHANGDGVVGETQSNPNALRRPRA